MADFFESNLVQPTAPSEYLLKKPKRKKLKVDESELKRNQKVIQGLSPPAGPGTTALGTKQRGTASNNHQHPPTPGGVIVNGTGGLPDSQCQNHTHNGSSRLGSPTEREQERTCHELDSGVTLPQNTRENLSQTSQSRPNSFSENLHDSTLQHGLQGIQDLPGPAEEVLLPKVPSLKEEPSTEKDSLSQGTQNDEESMKPDLRLSSTLALLEKPQIHCTDPVEEPTEEHDKVVNVSDMQEQFTKLNLKRCGKDPALHSSTTCDLVAVDSVQESPSGCTVTVNSEPFQVSSEGPSVPEPGQVSSEGPSALEPGHVSSESLSAPEPGQVSSESLSAPEPGQVSSEGSLVPEPGQVNSVGPSAPDLGQINSESPPVPEPEMTVPEPLDNASVIDVIVTPPETPSIPSSEVVFLPFHEDNEMRRSFNKRKKILRLLRYLFKIRWKRQGKTEDKQVLVEEEMLAEEEEDCGPGGARGARHHKKRPLSQQAADQAANTAAPPNKRRRPRKKNVGRAARRVRRSLGRGCRYMGHGLANMTSLVPETAYLGHVYSGQNYDCEYITSEHIQ